MTSAPLPALTPTPARGPAAATVPIPTAAPVPRVHLVTVVGGESALLEHFFAHYRSLGVESFYVIRHAETTEDEHFDAIAQRTAEAGLELYRTFVGPWDDHMHGRLMSEAMAEHPDEWYILADLDEFHLFDRPLAELIAACEERNATHVCGCFVDRIAADGGLPAVQSGSLWQQFPLGGAVTSRLVGTLSIKVGLTLGGVGTGGGHHGTPGHTGLPRQDSYIQVHHFKWTAPVLARLRQRLARYEQGAWPLRYPVVIEETRRILRYLEQHDGKFDVSDESLILGRCGPDYAQVERWSDIAEEAQRWASIFDSP